MLQTIQARTRTDVAGEGEGQSCALIIAQPPTDPGGWLCELAAESDQGFFLVKRFLLTRPLRASSRVVATCTFPTARRWSASIQSPAPAAWGADTVLPIGAALSVSERPFSLGQGDAGQPGARGYVHAAALGAAAVTVPPGAVMREISAVGDPAGTGTIVITVWRDAVTFDTLPTIPLPVGGLIWKMPEEDLAGAWVRTVTFANTVSHFAGWVE